MSGPDMHVPSFKSYETLLHSEAAEQMYGELIEGGTGTTRSHEDKPSLPLPALCATGHLNYEGWGLHVGVTYLDSLISKLAEGVDDHASSGAVKHVDGGAAHPGL